MKSSDLIIYSSQKIQLQLFNDDLRQSLKDMNQKCDDSCWSESQKDQSYLGEISENIISPEDIPPFQQTMRLQSIEQPNAQKDKNQLNINSQGEKSIIDVSNSFRNSNEDSFRIKLQQIHIDTQMDPSLSKSKLEDNQLATLRPISYAQDSQIFQNSATKKRDFQRMRTTIYNDKSLFFQIHKNLFLNKLRKKVMYFYHNYTQDGRSKLLNNIIRNAINDLSDYTSTLHSYKIYNFLHSCLYYFKIIALPVLDSESYLGFAIKTIFSVLNCLYLLYFSLIITFDGSELYQELFFLITRTSWAIEILIKLNTSTYDKSTIIKEREKIIKSYLRSKAFFDIIPLLLLTSFPIFPITSKIYFEILVFLKIPNVAYDMNNIQRQLCMMMKRYYFVQLFNLIFKLFLIAHIIACLWYVIAVVEIEYLQINSWTEDSIGIDGVWWKLYISAIYWSLTLMTAGSNTATTVLQTFFTSFIMLFTTIAFGYLLNVIGIILSEMDEKDYIQRKDLNTINEYMREKKISKYFPLIIFNENNQKINL